jgi:hypothetical protein
MTRLGLLLGILGLVVAGSPGANEPDPLTAQGFVRFEQEPIAPDFILSDHERTPRRLQEFRGNAVLLIFWTTW